MTKNRHSQTIFDKILEQIEQSSKSGQDEKSFKTTFAGF